MARKHDILHSRMRKAHTLILKSIDGLDESVCKSEKVSAVWTVKDVLGHLVSFGDVFRSVIKTIAEQDVQQYDYIIRTDDGFSEWNLKQSAAKEDWEWDAMITDIERDFSETHELIDQLTEPDLSKRGIVQWKLTIEDPTPAKVMSKNSTTIDAIFKIHAHHFKHHADTITAWRKSRQY